MSPEDKEKLPPFLDSRLSYTALMVRLIVRQDNREGENFGSS